MAGADGYASSMNGNRPAVALYERAARALPAAPNFNKPLSDTALLFPFARIAASLAEGLDALDAAGMYPTSDLKQRVMDRLRSDQTL